MISTLLNLSFVVLLSICTFGTTNAKITPGLFSNLESFVSSIYTKQKLGSVLEPTITPNPSECWLCALEVNALMQYTVANDIKIDDFLMHDFCKMFPTTLQATCKQFINLYGPTIIAALVEHSSPDQACRAIGVCNLPQCNLIPPGKGPKVTFSDNWAQYFQIEDPSEHISPAQEVDGISVMIKAYQTVYQHAAVNQNPLAPSSVVDWFIKLENEGKSPQEWVSNLVHDLSKNHTPTIDLDKDKFSQLSAELRGYDWRGRDCNDNDAQVYPGRKTNPHPGMTSDYNCNGISGVDLTTAKPYKDLLCANTNQLGVMVMGDSAGAHAEVPTQWVNGSQWNSSTFQDLVRTVANEVDLPQFSAYTGYADTGYTGPVSSVYKHLVQRNKCNFRDYQNLAVNGVSSKGGLDTFKDLARDRDNDQPLLLFLEMIGNDVCGKKEDFNHMTTPDEFRQNILEILDYLDTVVPPGSHLVTLGLANGSVIYEAVDGRTHPSGVTYNQLYDFQNCIEASMCWGWLNNNQTVRDLTTQRAYELNQVYRDIFSNYTAQNFDFVYYDFPTNEIFSAYAAAGGDIYELIEPVDGFHPSQMFHAQLGDWLWNSLMTDRPEWLGEENPNNDQITQLFGDQGGY